MNKNEITFDTNLSELPRARADFTYKISPSVSSIVDTGLGKCSVIEDIEAALQKIEYWHQGLISTSKILCRDSKGFWSRVQWDGKTATCFALNETDERKASKKLLSEN